MLQHHRSHGPVPAADVKPAAAVAGAVADDVDVHVDRFEGRGGWWLGIGGHGKIVWQEVSSCRLKVKCCRLGKSSMGVETESWRDRIIGRIGDLKFQSGKKSKKFCFGASANSP